MKTRTLWISFILVMVISFGILGYYGIEIYRQAPPIPEKVVTPDGTVIMTESEIKDGQNVWQSMGGHQVGTIWGHGAYQAPDWTADWLHREALYMLDKLAENEYGAAYDQLDAEQQSVLEFRLQKEIRENTYDPATKTTTISPMRAMAFEAISEYYRGLFMDDPQFNNLREAYAIPANSIRGEDRMSWMNAFFFWATWSTITERPGKDITYTNNWPPDKLVGNEPSGELLLWSIFSVIVLLIGIGLMVWYYATRHDDDFLGAPEVNPLSGTALTPSMKATLKYFWVVSALILVQILMGVITAHYTVEGQAFFGIPLADYLPYSVTRTWHTQLAIFWIATSWLATGLFIAPAISGKEPKFQKLGVDVLFLALLVIVVGSMAGQWMGIMQKLGLVKNFWFGHQGYEYVDLGRFWQIFLFAGLFIWLFLMGRAIWPALKNKATDNRQLLIMFFISCVAIASFYGAGLMWGRQTHLSLAEYWRWWVVHLWVEGFFEVFATVVIAFLFVRMKLIGTKIATISVLFATVIFLSGGILGTFHHLYFTGTPIAVLALGASFSALEVVPLVLMGFEGYHNIRLGRSREWVKAYKWPIYFFVAVAFWNFLGAGIFGFLINPPIALYYMQGLNTTPVHGHTALFGVYGFLGIGLMLFVLRDMDLKNEWNEKWIKVAFWGMNIGLTLMVLISVLPVGILQTIASVKHGLWYARSAEFLQLPHMQTLRWMRMFGDIIFAGGAVALAWFVFGLKGGWSFKKK